MSEIGERSSDVTKKVRGFLQFNIFEAKAMLWVGEPSWAAGIGTETFVKSNHSTLNRHLVIEAICL
jgi:hypothetical protein